MQTKKAFTLLELVVAMAIIATLLGLSLFGIQAVQRSQRDTERRASLQSINLEMANYYSENATYPSTITVTATAITFGTKSIPLKGAAVSCTSGNDDASTGGSTQACTVYCYSGSASSYQLGVNLEGNAWGNASSAQQLGNNGACGYSQAVRAT